MSVNNRIKVIQWAGDACIICLEHGQLSLEHVIPDALKGRLASKFLCKRCNSFFGHKIDAGAKKDPAIRSAASALEDSIPSLVADIEEGQRYRIHTDVAMLLGTKRGGSILGDWHHMPDGSVIAPEDQAIESLRGRMRAQGLSNDELEKAIADYLIAEPGEVVEMSSGLAAKKLVAHLAGPYFEAPKVDLLLFVKIAYEFAALLVGKAIYNRTSQLGEIRDVLKNLRRDSDAFRVEILEANQVAPFHGIFFEGNSPHAIIQIRLFGKQAFRVHFNRLAIQHEPFSYTHYLESGEHYVRFQNNPTR